MRMELLKKLRFYRQIAVTILSKEFEENRISDLSEAESIVV